MHRKVRSLFLPLTLGLVFSSPFAGCQQTGGTSSANNGGASGGSSGESGGSGGSSVKGGSGGNSGGSGGSSARGGSGGSSGGSGGSSVKGGSGGNSGGSGGSSARGGSGGSAGSGGTARGGSGGGSGGQAGSGGTARGGSGGNSGGSGGGDGGSGGGQSSGGSGGGDGGSGGSTASGDMISDFENTPGKADMIKTDGRTGYWYVYFPGSDSSSSPASPMTMSPALNNGAPIASEKSDSGNALHVKGSGIKDSGKDYAGTGAAFKPHDPYDKKSDAYDVSAYTGITFKIKSGSGTLPPVFFELLTKQNQPTTAGGNLNPDTSSGPDRSIGLYNSRGYMLHTPWLPTALSTSWQQVTIPFGYLVPRHLCDSATCTSTASATTKCQPPGAVLTDVLGIQFSFYATENGWPTISGATPGTFDLWIDDVAFTKDDTGIQTREGFPLDNAGGLGSCKPPQGPSARAEYLVPAYNMWKKTFVSGGKVIRPENGNDTVSEGIAYGMMIAVSMNDKELFDQLYSYWKSHDAGGGLMTWCIPAGSGSCSASGGSATDADEDAAFALLQADKVFGGGSYKSDAMSMISSIWAKDIDKSSKLPTGGSNYSSTSGQVTNPSYFAPSMYAAFKAAGDSNDWDGVIAAVYKALNTDLVGTNSNGLYAAWCSNNCSAIGRNADDNDKFYQYDSHRIPMRIGMDYCYNNRAEAKTYVAKTTKFFATNANAGQNGVSRIFDMYDPATNNAAAANPTPQNNSASIIGTAAVGAMADGSNQAFINDAYQAVFDLITRTTLSTDTKDTSKKTPYSYYNATVGLLTALIMTGAFSHQ
ncbi:MAG: hypothetical protein JXP73_07505 [Deltaproteobacteria bacterium]|nr:hypothetical protein [Deltaproteobacteria bacterium]